MKPCTPFHQFNRIPNQEELEMIIKKIQKDGLFFKESLPNLTIPRNTLFSEIPAHAPGWFAIQTNKPTLIREIFGFEIKTINDDIEASPQIHIVHSIPPLKDRIEIWEHVKKMLDSNRIFYINKEEIQYLVPNFLLHQNQPGGTSKSRFILDCSYISSLFKPACFSLTSPDKACAMLKGQYMVCFDFAKDFFQMTVRNKNTFGFGAWNMDRDRMEYFAAPSPVFGHTLSPLLCVRAFKPVIEFFKMIGFFALIYYDDLLIAISGMNELLTPAMAHPRVKFVITVLKILGLKLNRKGIATPTLSLIFLGKLINTGIGQIFPTLENIRKLINSIIIIMEETNTTLTILASLRGVFIYIKTDNKNYLISRINRELGSFCTQLKKTNLTKEDYKLMESTFIEVDENLLYTFYL